MSNVNYIVIQGKVCNNIKTHKSKKGNEYVKFSLAISRKVGEGWETGFVDVLLFQWDEKIVEAVQPKNKIIVTGKHSISPIENNSGKLELSIFAEDVALVDDVSPAHKTASHSGEFERFKKGSSFIR